MVEIENVISVTAVGINNSNVTASNKVNSTTNNENSKSNNDLKQKFGDILKAKQNNISSDNVSSNKENIKSVKKQDKNIDSEIEELEEEIEKDVDKAIDDILELLSSLMQLLKADDNKINLNNDNSLKEAFLKVNLADNKGNSNELLNIVNNIMAVLDNENMNSLISSDKLADIKNIMQQLNLDGNKDISVGDLFKQVVNKVQHVDVNAYKNNEEVNNQITNIKEDFDNIFKAVEKLQEVSENGSLLENDSKFNLVKEILTGKNQLENSKTTNIEVKNNPYDYRLEESQSTLNDSNKESDDSKSNDDLSKSLSKDEKLLSSILDKGESKINDSFSLALNRVQMQNNSTSVSSSLQVVNKDTMSKDIVNNFKYMISNGIKEVTVKVNPEKLGEISIKIIEEAGIMKAELKAKSKETYSLLSQQMVDIKKQLEEQNIKIQEVNVTIYEEDTTFFKEGQFSDSSFFMNERENEEKSHNNKNKGHHEEKLQDEQAEDDSYEVNNINMWV